MGQDLKRFFILMLQVTIGLCVAVLVGLALFQVVLRYVFASSLIWVEEVSVMIMIWMAWLGVSLLWLQGSHICLDIVLTKLSASAKHSFAYFMDILIMIAAATLFVVSLETVRAFVGLELSALSIDLSIKYYPVTVGSVCLIFAALLNIWNRHHDEKER